MKKLRRFITQHGIYFASLALALAIFAPLLRLEGRPATINEELLVSFSRGIATVASLRLIVSGLILINLSIVYRLLSAWFAKRRAGLSVLLLVCTPVWLLMQIAIPRFTLLLTPVLIALWAFDKAGRAKRATAWYTLAGLGLTAGWLQEPVGVTVVMVLCSLVLIVVKPRYAKHIARQSSLVLIIMATIVVGLSAASWKFGLGTEDYLVRQLSNSVQPVIPYIYVNGSSSFHMGLPGVTLVPLAIAVLAGLGAWQMFVARKRPRNTFLLILPLLMGIAAPQFTGLATLLLFSIAMIGMSIWAMMGIQYLHTSWKRVFPHNRLANSVGDLMIMIMLASLALYSFWFITKGWNGNPQVRDEVRIEWNGTL